MKGADCTPEQLAAARKFICDRADDGGELKDETFVKLRFHNLVRLVAWYGALRYKAGRDGTGGTLEEPGDPVLVEKERREAIVRIAQKSEELGIYDKFVPPGEGI